MISELGTRNSERRTRLDVSRLPLRAPRSPLRARAGFTLFEVLLVFSLLALLAAIVWPALDAPFAAQTLKSSAEQWRGDFTKARVAAMNSGRVQMLSFDATANAYGVVALDDLTTSDPFSAAAEPSAMSLAPTFVRTLPDGVALRELASLDDVTAPPQSPMHVPMQPMLPPTSNIAAGSDPTAAAASPAYATSPVYFPPDGTTSSARVVLVNDRGMHVEVRLRGLTGAVSVGDVLVSDPTTPLETSP